jgi:hypothetical protein
VRGAPTSLHVSTAQHHFSTLVSFPVWCLVGCFRQLDVLGGYSDAEAILELNVEVEFRRLV